MVGKVSVIVYALLILMTGVFVGDVGASPGYALRDPAVTGVPAAPEPDISLDDSSGSDIMKYTDITNDSWIGVMWGNDSAPGNKSCITIIGKWTRNLGASTVYDTDGNMTSRSRQLKVTTYFRQRFSAIYEFNDTNNDGLANVLRNDKPIAADQVLAREMVYKAVDLRTGWWRTDTVSGTEMINGIPTKTMDFTLTATNLSYIVIGDLGKVNQSAGDWKLNQVTFIFHMKGWVERADMSAPVFNISIKKSGTKSEVNVTKMGTKDYESHTIRVKSKEDHIITGWDYDPSNRNPGLVLETDFSYGYFLPSQAPSWFSSEFVEKDINGAGAMKYKVAGDVSETIADGGDSSLPDSKGPVNQSDAVKKVGIDNRVGFQDNWQDSGWFSWPSGTKVWQSKNSPPSDGTSSFQLQGAKRFTMGLKGRPDSKITGVNLLGGFVYTGGPFYSIRHDPENKMDMRMLDIPDIDNSPPVAKVEVPKGELTYAESVVLNGTGSSDPDKDPLHYVWMEGSTVLGSGPVLIKNFPVGRHNVTLTVDDSGSKSSTTVDFYIVNKPPTAVIIELSKGSYSPEQKVKLDGSKSMDPENGTLTYEWFEGTTKLGSGPVLTKKFTNGNHVVMLVVTDPKGATSQTNITITVKQNVPGFGASVLVAALGVTAMIVLTVSRRRMH